MTLNLQIMNDIGTIWYVNIYVPWTIIKVLYKYICIYVVNIFVFNERNRPLILFKNCMQRYKEHKYKDYIHSIFSPINLISPIINSLFWFFSIP